MLGVIIINIIIVASAVILEEFTIRHNTTSYEITYYDLELLKTGRKQKILKEISELTGKNIVKFKIRRVDYKKKFAILDISYRD
jgi:hypothetical protein